MANTPWNNWNEAQSQQGFRQPVPQSSSWYGQPPSMGGPQLRPRNRLLVPATEPMGFPQQVPYQAMPVQRPWIKPENYQYPVDERPAPLGMWASSSLPPEGCHHDYAMMLPFVPACPPPVAQQPPSTTPPMPSTTPPLPANTTWTTIETVSPGTLAAILTAPEREVKIYTHELSPEFDLDEIAPTTPAPSSDASSPPSPSIYSTSSSAPSTPPLAVEEHPEAPRQRRGVGMEAANVRQEKGSVPAGNAQPVNAAGPSGMGSLAQKYLQQPSQTPEGKELAKMLAEMNWPQFQHNITVLRKGGRVTEEEVELLTSLRVKGQRRKVSYRYRSTWRAKAQQVQAELAMMKAEKDIVVSERQHLIVEVTTLKRANKKLKADLQQAWAAVERYRALRGTTLCSGPWEAGK